MTTHKSLILVALFGLALGGLANAHEELKRIPLPDAFSLFDDHYQSNLHNLSRLARGVILDFGCQETRVHLYDFRHGVPKGTVGRSPKVEDFLDDEPELQDAEVVSRKFALSLESLRANARTEHTLAAHIEPVLGFLRAAIEPQMQPLTSVMILVPRGHEHLSVEGEEASAETVAEAIRGIIWSSYAFRAIQTAGEERVHDWLRASESARQALKRMPGLTAVDYFKRSEQPKAYALINWDDHEVQVIHEIVDTDLQLVVTDLLSSEAARRAYYEREVANQFEHEHYDRVLHSIKFRGLGLVDARRAFVDLLLAKHRQASCWARLKQKSALLSCKPARELLVLDDPCLRRGFVSPRQTRPVELLETKSARVLLSAKLPASSPADRPQFQFQLRGTGSYAKCLRLVQELLAVVKEERLGCVAEQQEATCAIDLLAERFVPFGLFDVLALGHFRTMARALLGGDGYYQRRLAVPKIKELCGAKWSSGEPDDCFKAVWLDTFLVRGIRMPPKHSRLRTAARIGSHNLDWPVAALLEHWPLGDS